MYHRPDDLMFVGVSVLVEKDGKFLFGKRQNMFGEGMWGTPGGHLDHKENIKDCASRELEEETGLIADDLELVSVMNQPEQPGNDRHYIQFLFVVKKFKGEPENREPEFCGGWEWFAPDQLPKPLFPPHKNFVSVYLNKQTFIDPDK